MILALLGIMDTTALMDSLTREIGEALKIKVSKNHIRSSIEERPYFRIIDLYVPPSRGGFNDMHLRKFQNYLIKEHRMFARPITIGKFTYVKFSGLWHNNVIKDGSARVVRDSLYIRFYLAKDLERFNLARDFMNLVKDVAGKRAIAIGIEDVNLQRSGAFTVVSLDHPIIVRKDVNPEEFRDSLFSAINSISDRFDPAESTFINVNLKGKIYRKLWMRMNITDEESIYRYGRINIRVVQ